MGVGKTIEQIIRAELSGADATKLINGINAADTPQKVADLAGDYIKAGKTIEPIIIVWAQ